MVMERVRRRISILMGRLGLHFIARSGLFDGFFSGWRGSFFDQAQKAGVHILPVHYYSPIPDLRKLALDGETPKFPSASARVLDSALEDLSRFVTAYGAAFLEIRSRPPYEKQEEIKEFRFDLAPYAPVEAETLYGMIRSTRPRRIIEIGCGHTTLLIAEAIRGNRSDAYRPEFTCIEPYRPAYLEVLPAEVSVFIDKPLQAVPLGLFRALGPGDLLFIDSSHVVCYGSDVVHELISILPELNPGVIVHFHDIFLPYDYPGEWLMNSRFFWNEQYLLAALLCGNPRYRVRWPLHQLWRERRAELSGLFPGPEGVGHGPSAFWIEVT